MTSAGTRCRWPGVCSGRDRQGAPTSLCRDLSRTLQLSLQEVPVPEPLPPALARAVDLAEMLVPSRSQVRGSAPKKPARKRKRREVPEQPAPGPASAASAPEARSKRRQATASRGERGQLILPLPMDQEPR